MNIAILGSGPSGLLAAHALAWGCNVHPDDIAIYSKGDKSSLFGCQYLHEPIPGMDLIGPVDVKYRLEGSPEMYWKKVYGEGRRHPISPEDLEDNHQAWDIRDMYNQLWEIWKYHVIVGVVIDGMSDSAESILNGHDFIISTIPKTAWCVNDKHSFNSTEIWATGDAPELNLHVPFRNAENNSVMCNSLVDVGWYRSSRVFNYSTVEWPGRRKPPVRNVAKVLKPISNDCDCFADRLHFFGRYGKWQKGILAHQVYHEVIDAYKGS
jgi:hypothetical protein